MLRQIGYNSRTRSYIDPPTSLGLTFVLRSNTSISIHGCRWVHEEIRIVSITLRNDSHFKWQPYSERWVIPSKPSRALWRVKLRHLIEDFGVVLQSYKAVSESFRD